MAAKPTDLSQCNDLIEYSLDDAQKTFHLDATELRGYWFR